MNTVINALPIVLDRKATIYSGLNGTDLLIDPDSDENVTLTTDGTNVEFLLTSWIDLRNRPYDALQVELNISIREFVELTQDQDTYVDLVLVKGGKLGVYITTQCNIIYDEVHTLA